MSDSTKIMLVDESAVQHVLECMRSARPIDDDNPLRRLVWVHAQIDSCGFVTSPVERDVALSAVLTDLITDRLRQFRVIHRIPTDVGEHREEALDVLLRDFQQANSELEGWSLLYHRYVYIDLDLQVQELSNVLGVSTRQVNRRMSLGLRRLTEMIGQLEIKARLDNRRLWLQLKLPAPSSVQLFGDGRAGDDLYEFLHDPSPPHVTVLVGARGIGKTALAQSVVQRLIEADRYEDFAWLDFDVQTAYTTVLHNLARELGYSHLSSTNPDEVEAGLRARLSSVPTLVVLDSADHIEDLDNLLPRLGRLTAPGHALVISRRHPPIESPVRVVQVQPLDLDSFSDLLLDAARRRRISRTVHLDEAVLRDLHTMLGGNPLAGRMVIGQMAFLPLDRVMENLSSIQVDQGEGLLQSMFGSVWEALDETARQAAAAISLLPSKEAAWAKILTMSRLEPNDLDSALEALTTCSLVDASGDEPLYGMSPLARRFVREQGQSYLKQIALMAQGQEGISLLPYLVDLLPGQVAGEDAKQVSALVVQLSPVVRRSGQWALWRDVLSETAEQMRLSAGDPDSLAVILLELGVAYRWLGKFSLAGKLLSEAVALFGETGDYARQAEALVEIGWLSQDLGHTEPAYEAFQRAAATAQRYRRPDIRRQALNGLVNLALHNDRVEQALELSQLALDTFEDDPPDGQTLSTHSIALLRAGAVDAALGVQLQALDRFHVDGNIPAQSRTHLRLGMAYSAAGQYDAAHEHFSEGLYLMESLGDALGRARTLTNLGAVYAFQEKWEGARSTWEQALGLQQSLDDRVGMAYTWYNLADMYWKAKKELNAREALTHARLLAEQFNLLPLLDTIDRHPMSIL
ncbi:MAG: tetratricopeptide repeat protein [Anaerolineae bacterium]|nr:tetratricopeptide repeat protein [Anaerolineae bacterium]